MTYRVFVVATLEASLTLADAVSADSPKTIVGDELLTELQRRSAAYRAGTMAARPAAEVVAGLGSP